MAGKNLKDVFEEYPAFGRPGQTKDITSKNFFKMIKEKGLMDKKVNQTEVDMIFTRYVLVAGTLNSSLHFQARSMAGLFN